LSVSTPVPLSGFLNLSADLAGRSCVALFHATTVPGVLPSELFPHEDRAPLSRPLAPLQLSTGVLSSTLSCSRSPLVSPTSALARSCLDSPVTMDFVSPGRGLVSRCPGVHGEVGSFRQLHLLRSFVPLARPFLQLRVAPRLPVVSLLGFCPFEAFLLPRLGFSTRLGLVDPGSLLRPWTPVCDLEDQQPPGPGELFSSTST
jgi:hypothetical protein